MSKVRSIAFALLLAALAALALSACGNESPYTNVQLDVEEVAREIRDNGKFVDTLERLDDEAVPYVYDLGSPVKAVVYAGSGATPEEIIVAEYADEQARAAAYEKINAHLNSQRKTFDDYNAEYRPLLNEPLFVQAGKYIIYCVSDDYNASQAVLSRYIESK